MYRAVKEKGMNKISRKQVQDWLSQQDVYTLHKPARRHYKRSHVIGFGIDEQFQADLADVQNLSRYNKGYKYLLTCIDIFSKYAWVGAFKDKTRSRTSESFSDDSCLWTKTIKTLIVCFRNSYAKIRLSFLPSSLSSKRQWWSVSTVHLRTRCTSTSQLKL